MTASGKTFKCHKEILTSRSVVFKTMLAKNNDNKETINNRVEIDDVDEDILQMFLYIMYTDKYDNETIDLNQAFDLLKVYLSHTKVNTL